MSFRLLGFHLTPAEDESTVRVYHCTTLESRLVNLHAQGYLTVTNKRVVFYAHGSSYGGQSVMHSEVPIADVSGISTFKGTYFSISHLLGAIIASFVLGGIISTLMSALVTGIASGFRPSTLFTARTLILIIIGVLGIIFIVWANSIEKDKIGRSVLSTSAAFLFAGSGSIGLVFGLLGRMISNIGATISSGDSSFGSVEGALGGLLLIGAFFTGLYALISYFRYASRETMSLTVGSKAGSNTPIAISGVSVFGLFNTAALKALNAGPAFGADAMIKELGAVITDIQTLGDLGVEKWKNT